MRLPALHLLERAEPGVGVVEADDEAERDLVVVEVVEEGAAVGVRIERPARGVDHEAGRGLRRLHLPQFLDADGVALRVLPRVEREARDQLPAEAAARTLGKDRVLAVQFHAELEALGRLAVLADTHVARGHALDRAVLGIEHLGRGKAGKDLDAERLGLGGEPLDHVAEADDVVAVVLEAVGQEEIGRGLGAGFAEEEEAVGGDRLVQRRAVLLPFRQQLGDGARIHDRAGKDVRAGLRALLQNDHRDLVRALRRRAASGGWRWPGPPVLRRPRPRRIPSLREDRIGRGWHRVSLDFSWLHSSSILRSAFPL